MRRCPHRIIEKGLASDRVVTDTLVSKYLDRRAVRGIGRSGRAERYSLCLVYCGLEHRYDRGARVQIKKSVDLRIQKTWSIFRLSS